MRPANARGQRSVLRSPTAARLKIERMRLHIGEMEGEA
jgi:hypothetical protein